jgi:proteic killer suppression protein
MVVEFETEDLQRLFLIPLNELKGKQKFPAQVIKGYKVRVHQLLSINSLDELRPFHGLRFEYLKGNRKGQCSLRINDQYRLIITPVDEETIQIVVINEISKHYE